MTETSAAILFTPIPRPVGLIPFGNIDVRITDPDDCHNEMGYDEEGELCLSSNTVMMGYYQQSEETKSVFYEENGKRWLRTQDLAMISKDGTIHITGREKRIYYKLGPNRIGLRVYPMRIEEDISGDAAIERCAVVGVPDHTTAYRTIVYLIATDNTQDKTVIKAEVEKKCRAELPESHIPDEYVFVSELPVTRAGKVDYRKLEEMSREDTYPRLEK